MREGRFGKANGAITMGDMARPKSLWAMWLGKIARWLRGCVAGPKSLWATWLEEVAMGNLTARAA